MSRPEFNAQTGNRIKYANSPITDGRGDRIAYFEDRSDSNMWDQDTGLSTEVSVTVQVDGNSNGGGGTSYATPLTVTVTRFADQGYDTPPSINTEADQTIGTLRNRYQSQLSLGASTVAIVNAVSRDDGYRVVSGDSVVFKEANKRRGLAWKIGRFLGFVRA